ncbi:MAG TPA: hypothetical protein VIM31_03670 [Candidatus Microsaccharimonas sp.]|jgi:ribosomal protein S27E
MGFFSKLFEQNDNQPKIEVHITSSMDEDPTRKKIDFSDDDPELMETLNSTEKVVPDTKKLSFSDTCPYCGVIFDKPIKRKKDCPECGKTIYVRTTQELYPSSALTEEQLNHAEFYTALKNTIYITKDDYKKSEEQLKKKWNKEKVNTYDILWSLYNNLEIYKKHIDKTYDDEGVIREVFQRKSWTDEAAARYQANRGHDPVPYLQGARNNAIQMAKLDKYTKGLTVKCYDCCDTCMKFDDKTFSIDFLEKTPVLPIKTCTRPFQDGSGFTFCNCSYQQYYEWSTNS